MFEVGDIIYWSDKIRGEQHDYIGLIIEDRGDSIFEIKPLSPQFIEEVVTLYSDTIKLNLHYTHRENQWRKLC